ncbi:tol-pal system YbgF family protein [Jejudonia soesokkakensis]|uniref:Tol-pal system YbgF family protein n=1 Tax=Jejudonia soesokkakensis TaxID=1323432 RepID=A0ABW2MWR1_9FLAO
MNNFNNISQEEFEKIERYLDGTMEPSEKLEFNTRIQEDPVLADLVKEVRLTLLGVESSALTQRLNTYHQEMEDVTTLAPTSTKNKYWLLGIAATVAIIFGVTWFMNVNSPSEKLYAKYYTVDPGLPTTMSSSDNFQFYDAMVNYKREEYSEAIKKWEALLPQKPTNDTLHYFLGVANLANGDNNKALNYLAKAAEDEESFLKSDAYYYLGLIHLKENNIEQAKKNFELSTNETANKILSELNR